MQKDYLLDWYWLSREGNMSSEAILKKLREAVLNYDPDAAVAAAREVIKKKEDPLEAIEKALIPAIKKVGDKFEKMEVFLLELMLAAEAMKSSMALLLPLIPKESKGTKGNIVIGTVQGDVHEIGKNVVANMLMAAGFNVTDLGVDVKTSLFITEAKKEEAAIIGASSLMSSTLASQKDLVDFIKASGERKRFKVMIGGGITSGEWAKEIGADGYGEDALEAIKLANGFVKSR